MKKHIPKKWRTERDRVFSDWQSVYGTPPRGRDWRELCEIAALEEYAEQMTLHASAAEQSGIDIDRRARGKKK